MRITLFAFALLICLSSFAQTTDSASTGYFIGSDKKNCDISAAVYYRKVAKEGGIWNVKDYFVVERSLQMDGSYTDDSMTVPIGMFYWYHENKQLERKGRYIDGKKEGMWKGYSEAGKLTDSSLFKDGVPYKFAYKWHDSGQVAMTGTYNDDGTGEEIAHHQNGKLDFYGRYSGHYEPDSIWSYYYENGNIASKEYFDKGVLLKVECYKPDGSVDNCVKGIDTFYNKKVEPHGGSDGDVSFDYADEMPRTAYNLNMYLGSNINYPATARENNIEGRVNVQFYIDVDGKVKDAKLIGSGKVGGGLDEEALRVVKSMPKWIPGTQHHRPLKVYFTLPVSFKLY